MRSKLIIVLLLWLTAGCANQNPEPAGESTVVFPETSACLNNLAESREPVSQGLNNGFSIVNWNIQKGKRKNFAGDLQALQERADLMILQEAPQESDAWDTLLGQRFRSFAEGFGLSDSVTGVLTVSSVAPVAECNLVAFEPWFGTRKATLVTKYALADSDESLLVVNIHSINFSIGVRDMQRQLNQAALVIEQHDGPVLLSGDFNTWRGRREEVVAGIVDKLGLLPLEYDVDHRKRWFGRPLDHIYVRGLSADFATSMEMASSDHNPMAVEFSYATLPPGIKAAP